MKYFFENILPTRTKERMQKGHSILLTFLGAGGKSSTVQALAHYYAHKGKRVLILPSTKIQCAQAGQCLLLEEEIPHMLRSLEKIFKKQTIITLGAKIDRGQGKIIGMHKNTITALKTANVADVLLCEGDGAARKSLKAPAAHEPVIPCETDFCLGIMGLDVLGKALTNEHVHRAEIFSSLLDVPLATKITFEHLLQLAYHEQGLFKGCSSSRAVFLNKFDTAKTDARAWQERLLQLPPPQMPWWYGSIKHGLCAELCFADM